jgi:hypothetical protein
MSAWKKGLNDAPRDRHILVRIPSWDCPCVMTFNSYDDDGYWEFVETLLSDVAGGLEPDEIEVAEWAEIPT